MKPVFTAFVGLLLVARGSAGFCAEEGQTNDFDATLRAAASYESGQSLEPLRRIAEDVRQSAAKPVVRLELELGLIQLLGTNATFEARKFACEQLGIIGSPAALPALRTLLQDDDTVGIACLALTTYPRGKADEILRAALVFANGTARVQILNTLGERADPKSVSTLAQQARDPDLAISEAAIASLGKIATPSVLKAIRALRANERPELKRVLAEATLRCADARSTAGDWKTAIPIYEELLDKSDLAAVRRSALSALLRTDKDGGEKRILEVLSGTDSALKATAIQRVASVPGHTASEKFAAQMHHLPVAEQALLIDSLALRGDDAARLELAKSLSLPETTVRRAAVLALGRLGDPYFVSLLARAAGSGDPEETKAVEVALASLTGGAETDKRLLAELKNALPKARVPLIAALARRQGSGANAILLEEADNSDPAVAKAALRALARTGGANEAGPLLTKIAGFRDAGIRAEAQSTASQLLGRVENRAKRSELVKQATEHAVTIDTRSTLLELLPACGDTNALETLKTAVADPEPQVREAALRALADWPDESAWDALLGVYRQPESETAHSLSLRGLARLLNEENARPDSKLIGRYKEVFASAKSEADLKLLLGTLSGAADPEALNLALAFLPHTVVHNEAAAAAKKIVDKIRVQHPELAEEAAKRLQAKP